MTISAWDIYLLTRLKGLNFLLAFATVIPFMVAGIHFIFNQGEINGFIKRCVVGIRCHTTFRHPFNFSWSGKTCDIRRSSKTTS